MNIQRVEQVITTLLEELGYDAGFEHFKETPARVAKFYENFKNNKELLEIKTFDNDRKVNEMIIVKEITFHSLCSHHMVPFFGQAHIAYIPAEKLVGLSKLIRILHFFANRLQIQEYLTNEIADYINERLQPRGVAVQLEAEHLCMSMRGVKNPQTNTITTALRGCFLEDIKSQQEFLSQIRRRNG